MIGDFRIPTLFHMRYVLLIPLLVSLTYYNSLNGIWAMDDVLILGSSNIEQALSLKIDFRKVSYITFYLNRLFAPQDVFYYRLVNVLLHCINGVLVYWISFAVFRRSEGINQPELASLAAALIFALHPIQDTAVAYVVQRMTLLSTFFVLLALLVYCRALRTTHMLSSYILRFVVILIVLIGVFAKENALLAIPLIMVWDYFFLTRSNSKIILKKILYLSLMCLIILAVTIYTTIYTLDLFKTISSILSIFANINQPIRQEGWTSVDVYWTPLQHLMTETRVIARYIISIILPLPQFFVFDWWGFPVSEGITRPISTLFSTIAILIALVCSIVLRKKLPYISFAVLWYLTALSLESFVAIGSDLYFEHRNYLPMVGLTIGIVGQIMSMKEAGKKTLTALVIFSLLAAFSTYTRNNIWKDPMTLWSDTIAKAPENLRAIISLGNVWLRGFRPDEAIRQYSMALSNELINKRPTFLLDALYSRGMSHVYLERIDNAMRDLTLMKTSGYSSIRAEILQGAINVASDEPNKAINRLNAVLPKAKGLDLIVSSTLLGDAYRSAGMIDQAIKVYQSVSDLDPLNGNSYYGIGKSYLIIGDTEKASHYLKRCLSIENNHILALTDLSDLSLIIGAKEDALHYANRAVNAMSPFYKPALAMGNAMLIKEASAEAELWYNKAKELGAPEYSVPFNKARVYLLKGDNERTRYFLEQSLKSKVMPAIARTAALRTLSRLQ